MIKQLEKKDNTINIESKPEVIVSNDQNFVSPEEVKQEGNEEEKKEINLSDFATNYLQSVYDWRNKNA